MSDLADRHVRLAAYYIGEELVRRQRFGHPIPHALRELHDALNRGLREVAQPETPVVQRLKTVSELAAEQGVHPATIRRKAQSAGAVKLDGRWIFEEVDT